MRARPLRVRVPAVMVAIAAAFAAGGCGLHGPATPERGAPCCGGPPPTPPIVEGVAEILSEPSDPDGYVTGEKIIVIFDSEKPLTVLDSPWLEIEIGHYARLAEFRPAPEDDWLPDRPSRRWRFEYAVARDDLDLDGISISTIALEEKGFFYWDGVAVWVYVRPGKRFPHHRVTRPPEPRVCTDERELAMNFSALAR